MDILIHISLIIVVASLFFIYSFSKSQNPMVFVILLSVIGLIFLYQDTTYINEGYEVNTTHTNSSYSSSTVTPIKTDFPFEWMLYITYITLFLLATVNMTTGEEYNTNKK